MFSYGFPKQNPMGKRPMRKRTQTRLVFHCLCHAGDSEKWAALKLGLGCFAIDSKFGLTEKIKRNYKKIWDNYRKHIEKYGLLVSIDMFC